MTKTSVYGGHIAIVMNLNTLDDSFECVIDENTCMLMVFANEASGLTNLFLHANNHIFSFSFLVCIAAAADTLCTHTHIKFEKARFLGRDGHDCVVENCGNG